MPSQLGLVDAPHAGFGRAEDARAVERESLTVGQIVAGPWLEQTQTWLYNQVRHLPQTIISHVYCESTKNLDQFPFPNVHDVFEYRRGRRSWNQLLRRVGIRRHKAAIEREIEARDIQVIHSHFGWVGWENCRLASRLGIPHVVTFYGLDVNYLPRQGWLKRYQELFRLADRILCEGPHMAECIVQLGCSRSKVRVHHLGVDIDSIPFRARSWTPQRPLRILIAASFREKKGIPTALAAVGQLRRELPVEVTVIGDAGGSAAEQSEKQRILGVIDQYQMSPYTQLLGYQPHSRFFEEAFRHDVYLAPSVTALDGDTEGGAPVGLIEMAATGMPVVSTRHCDIPAVVEDGVTGVLADERDVDGLVAALKTLASNPAGWDSMVRAARAKVEAEFDAAHQGAALAQHYEELHQARSTRPAA